MPFIVVIGRILFGLVFISYSFGHFSQQTIAYAASLGVPFTAIAVPFAGVMAPAGGLSVAFGYKTSWGALLLVLFLVPVTLMMHKFWAISDPVMHMMQQQMFLKNVALLGAALLVAHFGGGPLSLDERAKQSTPVAVRS